MARLGGVRSTSARVLEVPPWRACSIGICSLVAALGACDGAGPLSPDDDGADDDGAGDDGAGDDTSDGAGDGGQGEQPACLGEVARLDGPRSYVYNVTWSPVDDLVLAGTNEELRLLEVNTEAQTLRLAATLPDRATAAMTRWSADGRHAITAGRELKLLEVQRDPPALRQLTAYAANRGSIYGMDWSADGAHVITGEEGGAVRVFAVNVVEGTLTELASFLGHTGKVFGVSWSPDGRHAASVGEDGSVRLLEIDLDADPVAITQLAVEDDIDMENSVCWAKNGNPLLTGTWWDRHVVQVWNVDTGAGTLELQSEFADHPTGLDVMEWSRDRQRIVTAGHDDTMRLSRFDGAALTTMVALEDHDSGVHSASWSRDEAYMIMASSMVDRVALVNMRACPTAEPGD